MKFRGIERGVRVIVVFLLCLIGLALPGARAEQDGLEPQLIPIYNYKPTYFLLGNPYEKIQVSIKANIVKDVPLFFGYSQLMMWNALIHNPVFYDINYNPELFYRFAIKHDNTEWIDLGLFEHESNGEGINGERSWNRVYLRFHNRSKVGETMQLHWQLKAWVPISYNDSNRDLARYRGIYEAEVMLSDIFPKTLDQGDITLRLYPGGPSTVDPLRGGQELTFRTKLHWSPLLPLLYAQIFHGYGEDLNDYKTSRWGIRGGAGF